MTQQPSVDRRTLIRAGATFGAIAVIGAGAIPAAARSLVIDPGPTNALIGWLVIRPDGGGQIRIMQADSQFRPGPQVAATAIHPDGSIAIAARQATAAIQTAAATAWNVSPASCVCKSGRIDHPTSGQSIPFRIWTDFT